MNMHVSDDELYTELEKRVYLALETYANVHRGSGYHSRVTTHLFDQARAVVLDYLGLRPAAHIVIFSSARTAARLSARLDSRHFRAISSRDVHLPLGVSALAVQRRALRKLSPFHTGGGAARLISPNRVIWARESEKYEAGTPSIVNVIAFAAALSMIRHRGDDAAFANLADPGTDARHILHQDGFGGAEGRALLEKLRTTVIGGETQAPTVTGEKRFIHMDSGASTPTFSPIWDAARLAWRLAEARKPELVHEVRAIVHDMLGAPIDDYELSFTSNTTEAINLAAESFDLAPDDGMSPVILTTTMEHSSNDLPWRAVEKASLVRLKTDDDGFVDLDELESVLKAFNRDGAHGNKRIRLMALSGASNVLGSYPPIEAIGRIVHRYDAKLLVDGAQLVAHRPVDMKEMGIDALAFSAHKVYAPFGAGVLMTRKGFLRFDAPALDEIRSSGEENIGGIAALGKALDLLKRIGMDVIIEEEQALTRKALNGLSRIEGLRIHGVSDPASSRFARKGGVIAFDLKGMMSDRLGKRLSLQGGIGVRYGCHCAHMLVKDLLHVGKALQHFQHLIVGLFPSLNLPGLVRVSFGLHNTREEVSELVRVVQDIASTPSSKRALAIVDQKLDGGATAVEEMVFASA